jgi:hypothetical protein
LKKLQIVILLKFDSHIRRNKAMYPYQYEKQALYRQQELLREVERNRLVNEARKSNSQSLLAKLADRIVKPFRSSKYKKLAKEA